MQILRTQIFMMVMISHDLILLFTHNQNYKGYYFVITSGIEMKKPFLASVAMFLITAKLWAQVGSIEGSVIDKNSNVPLMGVTVTIPATNKNDISDQFGRFLIKDVQPGIYELQLTSIGYKTKSVEVDVKKDEVAYVTINMNTSSLSLSEVVIAGERVTKLNTLAAVDIKLRPVNTSQDILRIIPGLFIAQHAGGGKADQIFLRGYDLDHGTDINITVDGLPVNMVSHAHGQGYADLHFLIPELIEKVNFDKGPYNTDKGNLATAGWVEFNTKSFLTTNTVKAEIGAFDYKRAVGLFKLYNKQDQQTHKQLYLGTEYFTTDSYFDNPQNFHRFNLFGKYNAVCRNNLQYFITASAFDSKWNASGQIPERAVEEGLISRFGSIDNSEGGNTSRYNINGKLTKLWKNDWLTTGQLYYTRYHFNLYSNFTFFLKDSINGDGINQREDRSVYGYTGTAGKNYFINGKNANIELGYGFRYDDISNIELNHVVKRQFLSHIEQGDVHELNGFAYINQNAELSNRLELNAGLRYDAFRFEYKNKLTEDQSFRHQDKGTFSPKLNLTYTASRIVSISLNTGIGFHSNDTRVILNKEANDILPRVFATDLSFLIKPTKTLLLKTTFWQLYAQQEFVYVGDKGVVELAGRARRIGIDFSGRYQPFNWLYIDLDINVAKPRFIDMPKGDDYVPLAPTFTSIGGVTIKNNKGLSGSIRYRQMADRAANEDNTVRAKGYFVTDAVVDYIYKKIDISLSVENIFNTEWREAQFDTESRLKDEPAPVDEIHFTPGTPRFIKLGVSWSF